MEYCVDCWVCFVFCGFGGFNQYCRLVEKWGESVGSGSIACEVWGQGGASGLVLCWEVLGVLDCIEDLGVGLGRVDLVGGLRNGLKGLGLSV